MQQRIVTGKNSLYPTKFHIVQQSTYKNKIYNKE